MTRTQLVNNLRRLKICAGAAFILFVIAYGPVKDDADNEAARVQAQGARQVEWIDLEKVADGLSLLGRK